MAAAVVGSRLVLCQTSKFCVWGHHSEQQVHETTPRSTSQPCDAFPVMKLSDLMLHHSRGSTNSVRNTLWHCLEKHGYVVLVLPKSHSIAKIVNQMQACLDKDFFPASNKRNAAGLQRGDVYMSERGVPMWPCGYDPCDDIREAFRVHAGCPDSQPWPSPQARQSWLDALVCCREICDAALQLTLGYTNGKRANWKRRVQERPGDYSVMYAMHYFNDNHEAQQELRDAKNDNSVLINVKEHVDPSLFVLEPFLATTEGLQVLDQHEKKYITCDGPTSPIHSVLKPDEQAMVLFVGKAFCASDDDNNVQPTLHRVVAPPLGSGSRRTMIYEQKYEEYFPPPALD